MCRKSSLLRRGKWNLHPLKNMAKLAYHADFHYLYRINNIKEQIK